MKWRERICLDGAQEIDCHQDYRVRAGSATEVDAVGMNMFLKPTSSCLVVSLPLHRAFASELACYAAQEVKVVGMNMFLKPL